MYWYRDNWEKIIGIFLSIVVAGIIGFYSTILLLKGEIGLLRNELVKVTVELDKVVNPKLKDLDAHALRIRSLERISIMLGKDSEFQKSENKTVSQRMDSFFMDLWKK